MSQQPIESIELDVHGMTCDACAQHVTRALQSVPGVELVLVPSWQAGRAVLTAQPGIDETLLADAVKAAGYQATVRRSAAIRSPASLSSSSQPPKDYDLIVIGTGGAGMGASD